MTSSFSGWRYNQGDYTNRNIAQNALRLTIRGKNSYRVYQQYHQITQAWAGGPRALPEPWNGQQDARSVFSHPLASDLQPSGNGIYEAHMSLDPPAEGPTRVIVAASGWCFLYSRTRLGAEVGSGRSVDCSAKIFNDRVIVREVRLLGRVQRPFQIKFKPVRATYQVTVPPGGSVKVGELTGGIAYTIGSHQNAFFCASFLRFRVVG